MICKNKLKLFKISLISLVFLLINTQFVFAATKLDLSAKKIISKNGDYYFKIPISWENYIYAEREPSEGYSYFDKINFYYIPKDIGNNKVKFLTLYTYYIDEYVNFSQQDKILTTDKYVFTAQLPISINPYDSVNDRIIFSRFLIEISTPNFISSKIYISADKPNITPKGTLTVNNQMVDIKPQLVNNELYLPLRATAEKLGYNVVWDKNSKNVFLKNKGKDVEVNTNYNSKILNKNGTIYMPITFFIQKLGVNVDIDSNNNVKIKG